MKVVLRSIRGGDLQHGPIPSLQVGKLTDVVRTCQNGPWGTVVTMPSVHGKEPVASIGSCRASLQTARVANDDWPGLARKLHRGGQTWMALQRVPPAKSMTHAGLPQKTRPILVAPTAQH